MFTGIVEELGTVRTLRLLPESGQLSIEGRKVLEGTQIGDSIAINGVCLTVIRQSEREFTVDVMAETLAKTNLAELKSGSHVNLERALQLQTRLGGHLVSGHIDGTGAIQSISQDENAVWLTIAAEEAVLRYIVKKGSVTIDGVSLTVAAVDHTEFKVSVIPHTGRETTLLQQKIGDLVNLECDIIGKYVEKLLGRKTPDQGQLQNERNEPLSEAFLRMNGF